MKRDILPNREMGRALVAGRRYAIDPLDHGLLNRAVGVLAGDGTTVPGEVGIGEGEASWRFVPRDPWRAGAYDLVVLSILEDAAS